MTTFLRIRPEKPFVHRATYNTQVMEAWNGAETRHALIAKPQDVYPLEWTFLTEEEAREFRAEIYTLLVSGQGPYALPLWHEGVTNIAAITGASVDVDGALSDWVPVANLGRPMYIEHRATGSYYTTTLTGVSSLGGSSYRLSFADSPPGGTSWAIGDAKVYPAPWVLLDDGIRWDRHPVNAARASAQARLDTFRTAFGRGATLTTYDGLNVLNKLPLADGLVGEAFDRSIRLHDYGAAILQETSWTFPKPSRDHVFRIGGATGAADRQFFYAFLDAVKGRQKAFLLSTQTPDLLVAVQPTTTTLKIKRPPTYPEAVYDYGATFYQSLAHRRLALTMADGSVIYRKVTGAPTNNGDGTQSLVLDVAVNTGVLGNVTRVSFLETVRLATDTIETAYYGTYGEVHLPVTVIQG